VCSSSSSSRRRGSVMRSCLMYVQPCGWQHIEASLPLPPLPAPAAANHQATAVHQAGPVSASLNMGDIGGTLTTPAAWPT
jgi:hypothetical protein